MIEKRTHIALLYDFYGELLTDKQKEAMELFYDEDLSLGEIAASLKITRQAVYDLLKKSEHLLEYYEEKLALAHKFEERKNQEADLEETAIVLEKEPGRVAWEDFWQKWRKIKEGV